ncbi:hypothetical protein HYR54_02750 [Candidatus Acetothermia bacterium]|nr:hypothetical protein [Candidatus Acetothermia bacterium]
MTTPNDVLDQANARLSGGDYWGAIELFTEVLRMRPQGGSHAVALNGRASALVLIYKHREAIADLERAAELFLQYGEMGYYYKAKQSIQEIRAAMPWL